MKDTVMSMRPHDGDSALLTPSAVLLLNLGTPDAPTPSAVRRYLREFLSDKRVVELPRALWWVILNGVVLPLRATKVAKKYASIWLHSGIQNLLDSESLTPFQPNAAALSGSPLRVYSQAQADTLQKYFEQQGRTIKVRCVMRYGNPALADALDALLKEGVERVLLLPLYPQYSATTTASAYDAVFNYLMRLRNQPAIRTVKDYCDHPAYIEALRCHIEGYWQIHGRPHFLSGRNCCCRFMAYHNGALTWATHTMSNAYERCNLCVKLYNLMLSKPWFLFSQGLVKSVGLSLTQPQFCSN